MRSKELADLASVSVRTLRHYHAIGLMDEPPRGENGYRDYGAEDLARLLRIKRLASLGFSLERISGVLDEMDGCPADTAGAGALEALDELDRELELQIERLEEQRRTIALLKQEQLDPDLPVRFARAAKAIATAPFTDSERQALLITGHLYSESDIAELERTTEALNEQGLVDQMQVIQARFDELPDDAPPEDIERIIADTIDLLDPIIDCFDPANWDDTQNVEAWGFVEELMYKDASPVQRYAEERLEEELKARIFARQDAADT